MGRISTEHWVPAGLARVFAFFSAPENLPRLMPRTLAVRLENLDLHPPRHEHIKVVVESGLDLHRIAGPGSLIGISFRLVPFLPFRSRWVAEILEYEPLSHFVDEQRSGPMRSWRHRHSFRSESQNGTLGTVVCDDVEYVLPFGLLGRVIDALFIERLLKMTFQSRQRELQSLLLG